MERRTFPSNRNKMYTQTEVEELDFFLKTYWLYRRMGKTFFMILFEQADFQGPRQNDQMRATLTKDLFSSSCFQIMSRRLQRQLIFE